MHTSFKDAVNRNASTEALHIATITQESLCILTVETLRFKSSSLVKMHKLGNVSLLFRVQHID
jgi:N-terminal acetyltransferase B complex non-catalytic subunit